MSGKNIITQTQPDGLSKEPEVQMNPDSFDAIIFTKGYDVILEKAVVCPCKNKGAKGALLNCQNCLGTGWVFLDKIKTKMLLHSMNLQTKYLEWTEAKLGTVSISCRKVDEISFMDRITLLNGTSYYSQLIHLIKYKNKLFSYTNYEKKVIGEVFLFDASDKKLKRLVEGTNNDYVWNERLFLLNYEKYYNRENITISLRYEHYIAYHVLDINRDVMEVEIVNTTTGKKEFKKMPRSGVGRRAHYVLDSNNLNNSLLLDNSLND